MTVDRTTDVHAVAPPAMRASRGPFGRLLDLFSSIWFGVFLLLLLFIYSSLGSAGVPIGPGALHPPFLLRPDAWVSVREVFELSEFAWFHWWPFDVLIGLICVTLVVATLRRIPFNLINLGVWMIHTGLIILALGSVWYFSTKEEGDAFVARRRVEVRVPGAEPVSFVATPGAGAKAGDYDVQVMSVTPDWELLSGDDKGERTYKVSVVVEGPEGMFIRELLAGYPQYTEDLVRSDDPQQPFARAKKVRGEAIVDEGIELALAYAPQDRFYLMETAALYLREVRPGAEGHAVWTERPIRNLPRYAEHIASHDDVFVPPSMDLELDPLSVTAAPAEGDPLPDVTIRISDYLPYAGMSSRRRAGGDRLDPALSLDLAEASGRSQSFDMLAFDPARRALGDGIVTFFWVSDESRVSALRRVEPARLHMRVPGGNVDAVAPITALAARDPELPFIPIEGTEYSYRVRNTQDGLNISGRTLSIAMVEIDHAGDRFLRWVFEDPALSRDLPIAGPDDDGHASASRALDGNIILTYLPGDRPGLRVVAGPEEDRLRLIIPDLGETPGREEALVLGRPAVLPNGMTLTVTRYSARSFVDVRPQIIPRRERNRDVGVQASLVRVHIPVGGAVGGDSLSAWLPYHVYPFAGPDEVLSRFPYQPTTITLPDGRDIELLFSRESRPLPAAIALDDFTLTAHIGGYAGDSGSIRNWTSRVRFAEGNGAWRDPIDVSVNEPQEQGGYWFFQSQWDPPVAPRGPGEPGSQGLNYTVLGVGNREGVLVQLAGCCLSVIGMIYAFYVKPVLRRRREDGVRKRMAGRAAERGGPAMMQTGAGE